MHFSLFLNPGLKAISVALGDPIAMLSVHGPQPVRADPASVKLPKHTDLIGDHPQIIHASSEHHDVVRRLHERLDVLQGTTCHDLRR